MSTQLSELEAQLQQLRQEAQAAVSQSQTLDDLEQLRINYFGKKGKLSKVLGGMGKLDPADRPRIGSLANEVKQALQTDLEDKRTALQQAQTDAQLQRETLDVTQPGVFRPQGQIHPLNGLIDQALDIFVGMGYTVSTGPEIESDYYNFEALNMPPDHPARDMQDTFYLPNNHLLRTHTSPVQIRYMEHHQPPIRVVAPGRVYRRDTVIEHDCAP